MKFICTLITVNDMKTARTFYEEILGLTPLYDFGENVSYKEGIALQQKDHFRKLLGTGKRIAARPHDMELYFETDSPAELEIRLKQKDVEICHPVQEQPWGQQVLRFYDPDGHLIEAGEPMSNVVRRMKKAGLSPEEISEKTSLPADAVSAAFK